MRFDAKGENDPEPEIECRPWLELRGRLIEPIEDTFDVVFSVWPDPDRSVGPKRPVSVGHSDWRGQVTTPKNGRVRYVALTSRLANTLKEYRHLRSSRVLCKDDGRPLTRQGAWSRVRYAARSAKVHTGVHILRHTFCSHLVMHGAAGRAVQELVGHQDLTMTQRYMHLSPNAVDGTIRLLERRGSSVADGDIVETAGADELKVSG